MKIGVLAHDIIPHLRGVLHHLDDLAPFVWVLLTQDLSPQVGIFMDGRLHRGHIGVEIDLPLMHKAIDLPVLVTEQDGLPAFIGLVLIPFEDTLTFCSIGIHRNARTAHQPYQGITQLYRRTVILLLLPSHLGCDTDRSGSHRLHLNLLSLRHPHLDIRMVLKIVVRMGQHNSTHLDTLTEIGLGSL